MSKLAAMGMVAWLCLSVGCGRDVPQGWTKLGLPLEGGKVHDDGGRLDDSFVQFIHAGVTVHGPLCTAYEKALEKQGFEPKMRGDSNDGDASFRDLVRDGRRVSVSCSTWEDDAVLVILDAKQ